MGLAAGLLILGLLFLNRPSSSTRLQLETLRRQGYPTTIAELNAAWPRYSDAENLALTVQKAADRRRQPKTSKVPLVGSDAPHLVRGEAWTDPMKEESRAYIRENAELFQMLPELLSRPKGCLHQVVTKAALLRLTHLMAAKSLCQTLMVKAGLDAEEGRPHESVQALLGSLAIARSLEEEPMLISQLVRYAIGAVSHFGIERMLTRVQPSEEDLDALQRELVRLGNSSFIANALGGEVGLVLETFDLPANELAQAASFSFSQGFPWGPNTTNRSAVLLFGLYRASGLLGNDRAASVDFLFRLLQIGRKPAHERLELLDRWEADISSISSEWYRGHLFTGSALPAMGKSVAREVNYLAMCRCAAAGIAVERYRLTHAGQLPPSLDALVPKYLDAVPIDPADGKPLRFLPRPVGFTVYAVGENRKDDGGKERQFGKPQAEFDTTFTVER